MKEHDNSDRNKKDEEISKLKNKLEAAKSTIARIEQNQKKTKSCLRYFNKNAKQL